MHTHPQPCQILQRPLRHVQIDEATDLNPQTSNLQDLQFSRFTSAENSEELSLSRLVVVWAATPQATFIDFLVN